MSIAEISLWHGANFFLVEIHKNAYGILLPKLVQGSALCIAVLIYPQLLGFLAVWFYHLALESRLF